MQSVRAAPALAPSVPPVYMHSSLPLPFPLLPQILQGTHGMNPPPAGLSGLSCLQLCDLMHVYRHGADGEAEDEGAPLPAGPWLASLRWLSVNVSTLLSSTALLPAMAGLECVSLHYSPGAQNRWWMPAAHAFFDWAARHPPLRRLSLECGSAASGSEDFVMHLVRLCRRRPGLLVQCSDMFREGDTLSDWMWKADPI